jgi:hypothetical protein
MNPGKQPPDKYYKVTFYESLEKNKQQKRQQE